MRVLQVISVVKLPQPDDPGGIYGAERSTVLLCRGLIERGYDLRLICARDAPLLEIARQASIPATPLHLTHRRNLPMMGRIIREVRRARAQLLVAHDPLASRIMYSIGKLLRLPFVGTVRGLYSVRRYEDADRIIAVSEGVKRHIVEQGVAPERVRVVYNGADVERFTPVADICAAKRAVGLPADRPVIGLVGRLSPEKGHEWFLESAAVLAAKFPDVCFLLVGDGPQRAPIEASAQQLGIGSQLRCVGYQSDIVPWLAAMDMMVLPSVSHEGFARTLIEAGAMSKPCISSPVGGNAEAIVDGETGLIVPVCDVGALAQAMRRVLDDPATGQRMGMAARQRVTAHFSVGRMVADTDAVYRELVPT